MCLTREHLQQKYQISSQILDDYDRWQRQSGETAVYTSTDVRQLKLMMVLKENGFTAAEIRDYIQLAASGREQSAQRLALLKKKRQEKLVEIHQCERQIISLDYLRFQEDASDR